MVEENQDHIDIAVIKEQLDHIEEKADRTIKILEGNGKEGGLVTQVALNRSSIHRAWWWLGGISMGLIAIAFFVIRSGLT